MPTFGSLFAGIGGIDLGLERSGWACRWQVENNTYCLRILERHWPQVKRYGNIKRVDPGDLEQVDLIAGGFPCQPTSYAGKRRGAEDPRWLWPEMHRIIRGVRPRFVLVENPPGLYTKGFGQVLGDLAKSGYDAEWDCLPAAAFGAPHLRYRIFLVAYSPSKRKRPRRHKSREDTESGELLEGAETRGDSHYDGENVAYPDRWGSEESNVSVRSRRQDETTSVSDRDGAVASDTEHGGLAQRGQVTDKPRNPGAGERSPIASNTEGLGRSNGPTEDERSPNREVNSPRNHNLPSTNPDEPGLQGCRIFAECPGKSSAWARLEKETIPEIATDLCGVDDGVPFRVERLEALGNAVVPACAEYVGRRILTVMEADL